MAKETGHESKDAGQDDPLYKVWLSDGLEHLSRIFGRRLAHVLVAFAIMLLVFLAVSFVCGLIWYLIPIFSATDKLSTSDRKNLVQGFASVAQAAAVLLAGAVGLGGLFFTWRSLRQARESQDKTQENTQRTLQLTEQGQITDRFTKAIDQLESDRREVRIGGIYALARIAEDSDEVYYWPIIEILAAYVRTNAPWPTTAASESDDNTEHEEDLSEESEEGLSLQHKQLDIQAILYILRDRKHHYKRGEDNYIRLPDTDLRDADLRDVHLERVRLRGSNLQGARLRRARLWRARLRNVNFEDADLENADLRGADLLQSILRKANLRGAKLSSTRRANGRVSQTNLAQADLCEADFRGADLSNVSGVTADQLDQQAKSLKGATMPNGQKYEDWLNDKEGGGKDRETE